MAYTVKIEGLNRIQQRLGVPLKVVLQPAFLAAGHHLRSLIAQYPGPVKYPIRWKSAKQKRWYFANRRGALPYVRQTDPDSQRLGPSWAVSQDGLRVVVGTRVTYAPFVQDADRQQPFHHDTGWVTDREAVEKLIADEVIEKACRKAIRAAFG